MPSNAVIEVSWRCITCTDNPDFATHPDLVKHLGKVHQLRIPFYGTKTMIFHMRGTGFFTHTHKMLLSVKDDPLFLPVEILSFFSSRT